MNKKTIISAAVIVALIVTGTVILGRKNNSAILAANGKQAAATAEVKKISVKVVRPQKVQQGEGVSYKATLEAAQEGIVSAKAGGRVLKVLFEDGRQVTQGDPMVMLEDQDVKNQIRAAESQLAVAKATLQKLEASLENTQRTYERIKNLMQQGGTTQAELDNSETALKMLYADIASAQANIKVVQTNIENLGTTLADMIIRAPISGITDGKNVSVGQFVAAGAVLGKVKDISTVDAVLEMDQSLAGSIKEGQKAQVKLSDISSENFEGIVKNVNLAVDPASRTFKVRVQVNNRNMVLKSGVFAKVMFTGEKAGQSLVLPVEVILGKEGGYFVMVNNGGAARKQVVTTGAVIGNKVEVRTGLQGQEQVISTNLNTLQDGDSVSVVTE